MEFLKVDNTWRDSYCRRFYLWPAFGFIARTHYSGRVLVEKALVFGFLCWSVVIMKWYSR